MATRHITGEYAQPMRMLYSSDEEESHKELGASRQARDVSDVKRIEDAIVNQYQNPFDLNTVPCEMINLITGQVATKEIEKSLTSLHDTGLSKLRAFIEARLVKSTKSMSFWARGGGGALRYRGGSHLRYVFRGRRGLFLRPTHVRDFVKEGYFFVPRYEVWGSKSPYNPRSLRGSDAE